MFGLNNKCEWANGSSGGERSEEGLLGVQKLNPAMPAVKEQSAGWTGMMYIGCVL